MQIDDLLITEHQLGTRLNKSVHDQHRGEFSLLLAMLSHDALDFSQFHLPKTEIQQPNVDEDTLRAELQVGPTQLLAPKEFNMLIGQFNSERLASAGEHAGMMDIKLRHCLAPEPLSVRDDKFHIPLTIRDNCELAVRKRMDSDEVYVDNPSMNVSGFYDDLINPAQQEPLHLATA